jgi:hypothetical protein
LHGLDVGVFFLLDKSINECKINVSLWPDVFSKGLPICAPFGALNKDFGYCPHKR